MEIYEIEKRLNETPYVADMLGEPVDSLLGTDYWEIFLREDASTLGRIENGKVRLYPISEAEKSKLIEVLKEKKIPFKN